jgi:hypothetical protein
MLKEGVVAFCIAPLPIATLLSPVVTVQAALLPIATLPLKVLLRKAQLPMAMLFPEFVAQKRVWLPMATLPDPKVKLLKAHTPREVFLQPPLAGSTKGMDPNPTEMFPSTPQL